MLFLCNAPAKLPITLQFDSYTSVKHTFNKKQHIHFVLMIIFADTAKHLYITQKSKWRLPSLNELTRNIFDKLLNQLGPPNTQY